MEFECELEPLRLKRMLAFFPERLYHHIFGSLDNHMKGTEEAGFWVKPAICLTLTVVRSSVLSAAASARTHILCILQENGLNHHTDHSPPWPVWPEVWNLSTMVTNEPLGNLICPHTVWHKHDTCWAGSLAPLFTSWPHAAEHRGGYESTKVVWAVLLWVTPELLSEKEC